MPWFDTPEGGTAVIWTIVGILVLIVLVAMLV